MRCARLQVAAGVAVFEVDGRRWWDATTERLGVNKSTDWDSGLAQDIEHLAHAKIAVQCVQGAPPCSVVRPTATRSPPTSRVGMSSPSRNGTKNCRFQMVILAWKRTPS